jgi:hypothetical protein
MKNFYFILLALFFSSTILDAQSIRLKFCTTTDAVGPATDAQGNDQRFKGGVTIESIVIERFGVSPRQILHQVGIDGEDVWNDGVWVDGCGSGQNASCAPCATCNTPLINGGNGGTFSGTFQGNVRCRSVDNDLLIESTSRNEVCYTTSKLNVSQAGGGFALITVDYIGNSTDGFSTRNINIAYLLDDDVERGFVVKNSNFLTPQTSQVRTIALPVSTNDLDQLIQFDFSPNPVGEEIFMKIGSSEAMDVELTIFSMEGKRILSKDMSIIAGEQQERLNVSDLAKGQYVLTVDNGERRLARIFNKQ